MKVPIRVAVMGCVVNGPGEAREADLGIAAGKGQGFLVVRGEVVDKIPEDRFVDRLLEEARKIAAERASDDGVGDDGVPLEGLNRSGRSRRVNAPFGRCRSLSVATSCVDFGQGRKTSCPLGWPVASSWRGPRCCL